MTTKLILNKLKTTRIHYWFSIYISSYQCCGCFNRRCDRNIFISKCFPSRAHIHSFMITCSSRGLKLWRSPRWSRHNGWDSVPHEYTHQHNIRSYSVGYMCHFVSTEVENFRPFETPLGQPDVNQARCWNRFTRLSPVSPQRAACWV